MESRGIRNKNPFNIRVSRNPWLGKLPAAVRTDKEFEQFDTMWHGVRAGVLLLRNYVKKQKLDTVKKIIYRFAPPNENDIQAYLSYLSFRYLPPDTYIMVPSVAFAQLCCAIMEYESGYKLDYIGIYRCMQEFNIF